MPTRLVPLLVRVLLQKPCCFLVSYKNTRRPLLHNHLSHSHINTFYTSTLPPIDSFPNKATRPPAKMPTYIVSPNPNHPGLYRAWSCLETSSRV